ncbi:YlqD family protein [Virgibacillus sp. MSJ-26]|uniref:YlqD family protein n=1 Tax=Virgibacillus sp. MSJ-26 TaxID=2841522 RepID=UPI001C109A79|nr:YlqD family protein [Virgibacillus sp. MSJ-26]
MNIIKKIQVKQIITEKSKEKLKNNFIHQKMRLEQECQQLLFEQRKLENKIGTSKQEIKSRFQREINQRQHRIKSIDFKLEQLEILEIGSEIIEREVEALVEVNEGEHWDEVMSEHAIVIKDNIVIRIE